jgi:hypothetical protein
MVVRGKAIAAFAILAIPLGHRFRYDSSAPRLFPRSELKGRVQTSVALKYRGSCAINDWTLGRGCLAPLLIAMRCRTSNQASGVADGHFGRVS